MRTAVAFVLFLSLAPSARAAERLDPFALELGQVGYFAQQGGTPAVFRVVEILSKTECIVITTRGPKPYPLIVFSNRDTTGLVDDKLIQTRDVFKIATTRKVGGRTLFVAELKTKEKK